MSPFIVIDGVDGSGKATQLARLVERLQADAVKVKTIDFPRYYDNLFGSLIGECLKGEHGDFLSLDPYIASTLYAADRFESAPAIRSWREDGYLVISDRSTSSNMIHQGGKIADVEERKKYYAWLDRMEHEVFGVPKPDAVIFLHMPVALSRALLAEKKNKQELEDKKRYLRGAADQVESDLEYMERSLENALAAAAEFQNWYQIDCAPEGELRSIDDIHDEVYATVKRISANI